MTTSEQINELATALAKFQGECPVIAFDSKVKVQTKTGGSYSFEYASLKAIKETCKPILLKNELAVSQLVGQKQLTTILMHSSGQHISDAMDLPIRDNMNPQEIGSVITYMKRYSYSAVLGLVSDEDDDANIAEGNKVTKPKEANKMELGTILAKLEAVKDIKSLTELWNQVPAADKKELTESFKTKKEQLS